MTNERRVKLTKAQHKLLTEVVGGDHHCSDAYLPAKQLVAKGMCIWRESKYHKLLLATDEGRAAISPPEVTQPQKGDV